MHLCPEPDCLEYCSCHGDASIEMHSAPDECWHRCTETPALEPEEQHFASFIGTFFDLVRVTNDLETRAARLDAPQAAIVQAIVAHLDRVIDTIVLTVDPEETRHA